MPWPKAWVPLPVLSRHGRAGKAICSLPGINGICITMRLDDSDKTEWYRHLEILDDLFFFSGDFFTDCTQGKNHH